MSGDQHDHRPLWVRGAVRATCTAHLWQRLARTGAISPGAVR